MARDDPYHDIKVYHMAGLISSRGGVSPLCATRPRKIDLRRALWTLRPEAVTCPKCLTALAAQHPTEVRR